jgi:predicted secreted protein
MKHLIEVLSMNRLSVLMLALPLSAIGVAFANSVCDTAPCEPQINVSLQDKFNITLDSNPSTGYSWWTNFDTRYLSLENETLIPGQAAAGMTGVPGKQVFTFAPKEAGDTYVTMLLLQPWANSTIAERKIVPVTITG